MSTPAVLIRLPFEGHPEVIFDVIAESEHRRLADWLAAHPEQLELIAQAQELAEGRRPA